MGNVLFWYNWVLYEKIRFPLAPMILGVVLGKLAELNLARATAISDDLLLFFLRPWSLFFLIMAVISVIFPFYQDAEKGSKFSNIYVPASVFVLAIPCLLYTSDAADE